MNYYITWRVILERCNLNINEFDLSITAIGLLKFKRDSSQINITIKDTLLESSTTYI